MGLMCCLIRLGTLKHTQSCDDFRPFLIERSQSALQGRNLSDDVFRVSDRSYGTHFWGGFLPQPSRGLTSEQRIILPECALRRN